MAFFGFSCSTSAQNLPDFRAVSLLHSAVEVSAQSFYAINNSSLSIEPNLNNVTQRLNDGVLLLSNFNLSLTPGFKKEVKLTWKTDNTNNQHSFEIERGSDKDNFATITSLQATEGVNEYSYTDITALSGISYYRLKQLNELGRYSYSPILVAQNREAVELNYYPNPVGNTLKVSVKGLSNEGFIKINSIDGKPLFDFHIFSAVIETDLDVSYLSAGVYLLIYNDGKKDIVKQFIKN